MTRKGRGRRVFSIEIDAAFEGADDPCYLRVTLRDEEGQEYRGRLYPHDDHQQEREGETASTEPDIRGD
jgi:hypothetical protein